MALYDMSLDDILRKGIFRVKEKRRGQTMIETSRDDRRLCRVARVLRLRAQDDKFVRSRAEEVNQFDDQITTTVNPRMKARNHGSRSSCGHCFCGFIRVISPKR